MQAFIGLFKSKGLYKTILLIIIAYVFGVNITPSKVAFIGVAIRPLTDMPTLPTIFGMLFGDFLGWLAAPVTMGVILTFLFSKATFVPATWAEWLIPILSAAFGAAITAAIPYIAPQFLNATVYQVILMFVSGLVTWLSSTFGSVAVSAMWSVVADKVSIGARIAGDRTLSDRALAINGLT